MVLDPIITALQEPLKDIGVVIGSLVAPALELLAPIIKMVADVLVAAYDAIALFIKTVTFGLINIDRRTTDRQNNNSGGNRANQKAVDSLAGKQLDKDFNDGKISYKAYQNGLLDLTNKRLDQEQEAQRHLVGSSIEYFWASGEKKAAMLKGVDDAYNLDRQKAAKDTADNIAAYDAGIHKSQLENQALQNEGSYKQGLIGKKAYETEKLRIALANLDMAQSAEVVAAKGDKEKIAAIDEHYHLLNASANQAYIDEMASYEADIHKGTLENESLQSESNYKLGLTDKKAYEQEKLRIALANLGIAQAAEIAAAKGDAEKIAIINEHYRLLNLNANQTYIDSMASYEADIHKGKLENQNLQNERDYKQGLISKESYEKEKLRITLENLDISRAAELQAAQGNAEKIANINEHYRQAGLDANQTYLDAMNQQWIDLAKSIESSIAKALSDGFKNAAKKGDFSSFKGDMQKEIGKILFDATLQAIEQTVALDAFITPAVNAFKEALKTGDKKTIDAAFQGVLNAGKAATAALMPYQKQIMAMREYSGVGAAEDVGKILAPADGKTGGITPHQLPPNAAQAALDAQKTPAQLLADIALLRQQNEILTNRPVGPYAATTTTATTATTTTTTLPVLVPVPPSSAGNSANPQPTGSSAGNGAQPLPDVAIGSTPVIKPPATSTATKPPEPAKSKPEDLFSTAVQDFGKYVDRLVAAPTDFVQDFRKSVDRLAATSTDFVVEDPDPIKPETPTKPYIVSSGKLDPNTSRVPPQPTGFGPESNQGQIAALHMQAANTQMRAAELQMQAAQKANSRPPQKQPRADFSNARTL